MQRIVYYLRNTTRREWIIAASMTLSVSWGLLLLLIFVKAAVNPDLYSIVTVEPALRIPELIMALVGAPVMIWGYITIATELKDDIARRMQFDELGIDTVET